jgi:hypothetical protein
LAGVSCAARTRTPVVTRKAKAMQDAKRREVVIVRKVLPLTNLYCSADIPCLQEVDVPAALISSSGFVRDSDILPPADCGSALNICIEKLSPISGKNTERSRLRLRIDF